MPRLDQSQMSPGELAYAKWLKTLDGRRLQNEFAKAQRKAARTQKAEQTSGVTGEVDLASMRALNTANQAGLQKVQARQAANAAAHAEFRARLARADYNRANPGRTARKAAIATGSILTIATAPVLPLSVLFGSLTAGVALRHLRAGRRAAPERRAAAQTNAVREVAVDRSTDEAVQATTAQHLALSAEQQLAVVRTEVANRPPEQLAAPAPTLSQQGPEMGINLKGPA